MLQVWVHTFTHDTKVHIALFLVFLDFLFGVAAALKRGTFRLSYISDFAKNDILGKLVPYFALYVLALVSGGTNLVIPVLDFGLAANALYVAIVAAWTGSILSSISALGIAMPKELGGPEKAGPPPVVTPTIVKETTIP